MKKVYTADFRFCDRCGKAIEPFKGLIHGVYKYELCHSCDTYFYNIIKSECKTTVDTKEQLLDGDDRINVDVKFIEEIEK